MDAIIQEEISQGYDNTCKISGRFEHYYGSSGGVLQTTPSLQSIQPEGIKNVHLLLQYASVILEFSREE